jgi:hypothetical protein
MADRHQVHPHSERPFLIEGRGPVDRLYGESLGVVLAH